MFSSDHCTAPTTHETKGRINRRYLTALRDIDLDKINDSNRCLIVNLDNRVYTCGQVVITNDNECEITKLVIDNDPKIELMKRIKGVFNNGDDDDQIVNQNRDKGMVTAKIDGILWQGNCIKLVEHTKGYDLFIDSVKKTTLPLDNPSNRNNQEISNGGYLDITYVSKNRAFSKPIPSDTSSFDTQFFAPSEKKNNLPSKAPQNRNRTARLKEDGKTIDPRLKATADCEKQNSDKIKGKIINGNLFQMKGIELTGFSPEKLKEFKEILELNEKNTIRKIY